MDQSEQPHAHKKEPGFEPAATVQSVVEAGEMPAWLNKPVPPTAGQRWGQRFMFLGVALVTVALTAGATMLGLELYESHSSMEVVAAHSQAAPAAPAAEALPYVEKRESSLPPLVMLPQDPNAAHKKEAGAAGAPVVAPALAPAAQLVVPPADHAAKVVAAPEPAVARNVDKPVAPAVAVKKDPAAVKPVKAAAQLPKKPKLTPAAAAQKAAILAKRIATPVEAKPHRVKPIKGTMLQPPRERGLDPAFQDPPPADRRCRPGELARECEARNR